jgi:hypothetical protein
MSQWFHSGDLMQQMFLARMITLAAAVAMAVGLCLGAVLLRHLVEAVSRFGQRTAAMAVRTDGRRAAISGR